MRRASLIAMFVVAVAHSAFAQPSLTFSASQILHGEIVRPMEGYVSEVA